MGDSDNQERFVTEKVRSLKLREKIQVIRPANCAGLRTTTNTISEAKALLFRVTCGHG